MQGGDFVHKDGKIAHNRSMLFVCTAYDEVIVCSGKTQT